MVQSEREHMMLMMRRELETLLAGVALVLIFANFHSPGWTNLFRAPTHSPRAAVSRVYSMATPDAGPSIVVYVTVPNKETGILPCPLGYPYFHDADLYEGLIPYLYLR
jgi:hypothetical protein